MRYEKYVVCIRFGWDFVQQQQKNFREDRSNFEPLYYKGNEIRGGDCQDALWLRLSPERDKHEHTGNLTNGVFLYDFQREKIIAAETIGQKSALEVVDAFRRHGLSCFVYTYEENGISIYYEDEALQTQTQYYSDRALESCEEVKLVENVREILAEKSRSTSPIPVLKKLWSQSARNWTI